MALPDCRPGQHAVQAVLRGVCNTARMAIPYGPYRALKQAVSQCKTIALADGCRPPPADALPPAASVAELAPAVFFRRDALCALEEPGKVRHIVESAEEAHLLYGQVFAPEQVFCHADAPCVDSLDERLSGVAAEEGAHGRAVRACVCGNVAYGDVAVVSSCSKLTNTIDLAGVLYIFATILCALSGRIPKSHRSRSPQRSLFGLWHASQK